LNLPNNTFCVLPWISLEASPIGTVRPCCLADDEIRKESGEKYNLNEDPLMGIQDCTQMENLRKQFLKGERPTTCRKCWDEEDVGRTSKRMNTLTRLGPMLTDITSWGESAYDLRFIDLKLGNICNLKCRICGSWSSSTFAGEEIKFATDDSFHREMNKKGAWPRTADQFWTSLDFASPDIRYIEFTGGEPFMIKEHFKFLQRLVEKGVAKNIEIHYNTNGTQWPESYVHLWKEFKHVEIAFSIDNIGPRFEYERTNAKWDNVIQNLNKFFNLRDETTNVSLQLCTTINIYNVLYLRDIIKWQYFEDFNFVFWNMLHDAPENCIKSLPQHAKDVVSDTLLLTDEQISDSIMAEFKNIVKFMYSGTGVDPLPNIERLDERRGVSLKDTHPELYELLYTKD